MGAGRGRSIGGSSPAAGVMAAPVRISTTNRRMALARTAQRCRPASGDNATPRVSPNLTACPELAASENRKSAKRSVSVVGALGALRGIARISRRVSKATNRRPLAPFGALGQPRGLALTQNPPARYLATAPRILQQGAAAREKGVE